MFPGPVLRGTKEEKSLQEGLILRNTAPREHEANGHTEMKQGYKQWRGSPGHSHWSWLGFLSCGQGFAHLLVPGTVPCREPLYALPGSPELCQRLAPAVPAHCPHTPLLVSHSKTLQTSACTLLGVVKCSVSVGSVSVCNVCAM